MSQIELVKDKQVDYRFVSNYHDEPLQGSCYYLGKLYHFRRKEGTDQLFLIHLNKSGERKWKLKQLWFELCVGYHWSWYPKNRSSGFYYRRPQWLYKILLDLYYRLK
jgi:hypothetical protein